MAQLAEELIMREVEKYESGIEVLVKSPEGVVARMMVKASARFVFKAEKVEEADA